MTGRAILIIGGTGALGGAVAKALLKDESQKWLLVVLTRHPESSQAKALVHLGQGRVTMSQGDLDDEESLRKAMQGVYGVFCNTNFWSTASIEGERRQGLIMLRIAQELNIKHFVFSSLDSVSSISGGKLFLPHYDAKASIEHEIDWRRSDEYMRQVKGGWYRNCVSVLVTCPYFENFQSVFVPEREKLSDGKEKLVFKYPLSGDGAWQMVALADIGAFASIMFADCETWGGQTLRIASEELPMKKVAEQFTEITGIPSEYDPPSVEEFLNSGMPNSHDVLNNFIAYREGYVAPRDYSMLRKLHPGLRTFKAWLRETEWRGEAREVQKDSITGK